MKVTCESCGAVYLIPEEKLTKEVSRATCKKCGAKIIIRRPPATEDGLDDLRVGVSPGVQPDEDSVIEHEERTVIAHVPELQRFDATPPLSSGTVSSQEELESVLGGRGASSGPAPDVPFSSPPTVEDEYQEKTEVQPSGQRVAPAAKLGSTPVARPADAAAMPMSQRAAVRKVEPSVGVPAPKITADTSPLPPSGVSTAQPVAPPPPAARIAQKRKADVVEIFSHDKKDSVPAEDFRQPAPKMLLGLLGLAFFGVLAFVHHGLWGLTALTAAGFYVALYSILAVFLAQLDLTAGRRIDYVKVFLIPAGICMLLLAILMKLQSDDLAFLYPDVDIKLVQRWIRERPEVPEAVQGETLGTKIAATFREKERRRVRRNLRRQSPSPVPAKATPAPRPEASLPPGVNPDLIVGRTRSELPKSDLTTVARVNLNRDAIEKELERLRVDLCFEKHARVYNVSGKITFRILIDPDGRVRRAVISDPVALSRTELETCMVDKVSKAHFPAFAGSKPEWYDRVYYR